MVGESYFSIVDITIPKITLSTDLSKAIKWDIYKSGIYHYIKMNGTDLYFIFKESGIVSNRLELSSTPMKWKLTYF